MSKAIVDMDLLKRVHSESEMWLSEFGEPSNGGYTAAFVDLEQVIAQPAEAEGVEIIGYVNPENIERMRKGELCGYMIEDKEDERRSCAVITLESHVAALSVERIRADVAAADANDAERALATVTAERARLLHSQQVLMQSRNAHRDERDKLRAAISDPEAVHVNMKRGTIAKPSLRSMIDLYGEVVNGEDAQLLEIARLRAEVEALRPDAELYRRLRDLPDDQVGTAGVPCVAVPRGPFSGTYVSGAELDAAMAAKEA